MKKKKRTNSEIDFWQSNTDLMSALVLVLLLIIMLLILYLMQIPEDKLPESEKGNNYNVDNQLGDENSDAYHYPEVEHRGGGDNDDEDDDGDDDDNGGGGDSSGTGIGTDPQYNYEYPFPSHSGREWNKAAVFATVIDQETGRAIREPGITFELYEEQIKDDGGVLRFLNTYYPVKIEYRNYETTEEGVFYLPEKIEEGHYYFKQITDLEGYDRAEAVAFDVDNIYDWPDPFVVSIEVSPSKNVIPITMEDAETHEPIADGTFKVNAAEDIKTADLSTRFTKNELADTVLIDDEGNGESKELYLGKYKVTQENIPQYYASIDQAVDVEVKKKDGNTPKALEFSCEKTKINVSLSDELYDNIKLEGAEFVLACDEKPEFSQNAVTDANGEIVFTDLEKNVTYKLRQKSSAENYKFSKEATEIYVSKEGRIGDKAETSLHLTNYIVRVQIDAKDKLFGKPVSNTNMALYDSADQLVRTWTTSGAAEVFENLPGGTYYVLLNGDKNKRYSFEFTGDQAMQEFSVTVWTMSNILTAIAGIAAVTLCMFGAVVLIKKKKPVRAKKKREDVNREE